MPMACAILGFRRTSAVQFALCVANQIAKSIVGVANAVLAIAWNTGRKRCGVNSKALAYDMLV